MTFLITFIVLSIVNVIFSTVRSIATIKGSKAMASLLNGGYFAFYNVMLIYTVADFPMWEKCVITFVCNVIGVFVVKLIEEKMSKDKLWKVELTVKEYNAEKMTTVLNNVGIPYNVIVTNDDRYTIFNIYCSTKVQSSAIKEIAKKFNAKYFASESKTL